MNECLDISQLFNDGDTMSAQHEHEHEPHFSALIIITHALIHPHQDLAARMQPA